MTDLRVESGAGLIASYVHTSPTPSLGRMAALVALETSTSSLTPEQQSEAKARLSSSSYHVQAGMLWSLFGLVGQQGMCTQTAFCHA